MAEAFLTTKGLHKSFNSHKAVNGVSFSIDKSEIFGLLGPNGAGNYPQYKKENIQDIVRTLYSHQQKEIADTICNSYMAKGIDFLRPIYEEHLKDKIP